MSIRFFWVLLLSCSSRSLKISWLIIMSISESGLQKSPSKIKDLPISHFISNNFAVCILESWCFVNTHTELQICAWRIDASLVKYLIIVFAYLIFIYQLPFFNTFCMKCLFTFFCFQPTSGIRFKVNFL